MRERQFRIFDKHRKIMLYSYTRGLDSTYISLDGKLYREELETFEDRYLEDKSEDFIILEWTGLYDSTKWESLNWKEQRTWHEREFTKGDWIGKEIYRGDIVKGMIIDGNDEYVEIIKNIFWHNIYCGFYVDREMEYRIDELEALEIIGNIYENPELLK